MKIAVGVIFLMVMLPCSYYIYNNHTVEVMRQKHIDNIRQLKQKISKDKSNKKLKLKLIEYLDVKYATDPDRPTIRGITAANIGNLVERSDVDMSLAIPQLMEIVKNHINHQEHRNAIYALGTLGIKAKVVMPFLVKQLNSDDLLMRMEAVEGLGRMGSEAEFAVPQLVKLLSEYYPATTGDDGPQIRNFAAKALGDIKTVSKDAVENLKKGLVNGTFSFKIACAVALIKIDQKNYGTEAMAVLDEIHKNGANSYQRSMAYGAVKEVKALKKHRDSAPNTPKK